MNDQQIETLMRVQRSLTNISPNIDQIARIESIRTGAKAVATAIIASTKPGREQALALTKLEETTMWAVKAVIMEGGVQYTQDYPNTTAADDKVVAEIKPDNSTIGVKST